MNKEIIVIGGNHHNTLSILRSLGERGILSSLILLTGDKRPYVSYSKYIKEVIVISNESKILDSMYSLHKTTEKSVVIACSDTISSFLDCHHNVLSKDFILPGSAIQGRITKLMDKAIMSKLAFDNGLQIPSSWVIRDDTYSETHNISYPCIVKPLTSKNGSKLDIAICKTKEELDNYLKEDHCPDLQIQSFIKKDIEFQLIGCSLNGGEKVIIPGASIILRQPENTNTGFLRYVPKSQFTFDEESCTKFIKSTGYSGLFSLEFLRGNDGIDYFMEINFRNDGNSICVTASGMNLPYIWYLYCNGHSYESEIHYEEMKEVIVMPEFNDFDNVKKRKITLLHWISDIIKTDRFMEYDRQDSKPFWVQLYRLLRSKV